MEQTSERLPWLDIARAMAIILVVFGHTARGGMGQKLVYSFHVAAFFLLSGMTCKTDDLKKQIRQDFLRILVPYYIFGTVSILIFFFLGTFAADAFEMDVNTSLGNNFLELLIGCPKGNRLKFNMPLWFLPCLFATKLVYYGLYKLCRGKERRVLVGSIVLAACSFIYTGLGGISLPFNLSVALKMLLFFALGRCLFLLLPKVSRPLLSGAGAGVSGLVLLAVTCAVAWFAPKVNYSGDTFPHIAAFLVTAISGSLGICLTSMSIGKCRWLEYIGKRTLAILVMHKFPILLFQTVGPLKLYLNSDNSLAGNLSAAVVTAAAIALCLGAEWIIRRFFPFMLGDFSRRKPCAA